MRNLLIFITAFILLVSLLPKAAFANEGDDRTLYLLIESNRVLINQEESILDSSDRNITPILLNGYTMVPLRFFSDFFSFQIDWNSTTKEITIGNSEQTNLFQIDNPAMQKNGEIYDLPVGPTLVNNRTFVPLRAIAEAFSKSIGYYDGLITISAKETLTAAAVEEIKGKLSTGFMYSVYELDEYLASYKGLEEAKEHASLIPNASIRDRNGDAVWDPSHSAIKLVFTGDILLDGYVGRQIEAYGVNYPFAALADELKNADLTFGNLETSVSTRGKPAANKTFTFRSDPKTLEGLVNAGFDAVSLANNHTLDYGVEALYDTFEHLKDYNLGYTGAGINQDEAFKPFIKEIRGKKVAVLGLSRVIPEASWYATKSKPGIAQAYSNEPMMTYVKKAAKENDYTIIFLHWNKEFADYPEDYAPKMAKAFIDAGADAVIGAHSHSLMGIEWYKGKPIYYSLGNFVFNKSARGGEKTLDSMYVELELKDDEVTTKLTPVKIINGQPRKMDENYNRTMIDKLNKLSFNASISETGEVSIISGEDSMINEAQAGSIEEFLFDKGYTTFSYYYHNLNSGQEIKFNERQPFRAASTIKLPLALYVYQLIADGKLPPDEELPYQDHHYYGGTGIIQFDEMGTTYTIQELVELSLKKSDNIAFIMLRERVGRENFEQYLKNIGAQHVYPDGINITSAQDLVLYAKELFTFSENAPMGEELLTYLQNTDFNGILPEELEGIPVSHKVGYIPMHQVYNDVAIVLDADPYILSIMIQGIETHSSENIVAEVFAMAHAEHTRITNQTSLRIERFAA
jgi:poly-gamma-glutamate capsule biosynthesis protein CapA/YwtB (metallophosphatase superfamily)